MDDYALQYIETLLMPILLLIVSPCLVKFCCKFCKKISDTDSDLDLSSCDHVYVIPNPIHVREARDNLDETEYPEDSEFTPPPYDIVCPPPSYAEASFKFNISDVGVTPDSSYVPPPPYSPPLNMTSQPSGHQQ